MTFRNSAAEIDSIRSQLTICGSNSWIARSSSSMIRVKTLIQRDAGRLLPDHE